VIEKSLVMPPQVLTFVTTVGPYPFGQEGLFMLSVCVRPDEKGVFFYRCMICMCRFVVTAVVVGA